MADRHGRVRQLVDGKIVRRVAPEFRQRTYTFGAPVDRVKTHIAIDSNGCWLWTGSKTTAGYGHLKTAPDTYDFAHRVTYEHEHGPVPDGLELDHLCRVRACCNPDHLEAVTHAENVRRGAAMVRSCGHPDSAFYRRKSTGRIVHCRTCRNDRRRLSSPPTPGNCAHCSASFEGSPTRKYCGPACQRKARWQRERRAAA